MHKSNWIISGIKEKLQRPSSLKTHKTFWEGNARTELQYLEIYHQEIHSSTGGVQPESFYEAIVLGQSILMHQNLPKKSKLWTQNHRTLFAPNKNSPTFTIQNRDKTTLNMSPPSTKKSPTRRIFPGTSVEICRSIAPSLRRISNSWPQVCVFWPRGGW